MKIGITLGKYRPPHLGHIKMIENAASEVDLLFVIVFGDSVSFMDSDMVRDSIKSQFIESEYFVEVLTKQNINVIHGYVPEILLRLQQVVEPFNGDDVTIFSGQDRLDVFERQLTEETYNPVQFHETHGEILNGLNINSESLTKLISALKINSCDVRLPRGNNEIVLSGKLMEYVRELGITVPEQSFGRVSGSLVRALIELPDSVYEQHQQKVIDIFEACMPTIVPETDYQAYRNSYRYKNEK